ncbi:MAG: hypothetical protein H6597_00190 [Flavobacteriales bacterium]|nr:hypothetical protein [Flavobacteriales bacterium]
MIASNDPKLRTQNEQLLPTGQQAQATGNMVFDPSAVRTFLASVFSYMAWP